MDPLDVLDSTEIEWYIRLAAGRIIANDRESSRPKPQTIYDPISDK